MVEINSVSMRKYITRMSLMSVSSHFVGRDLILFQQNRQKKTACKHNARVRQNMLHSINTTIK